MSNASLLIASGRNLLAQLRAEAALEALDGALRREPGNPTAHYLRGEALFLLRRLDEALDSHAAAQAHRTAEADDAAPGEAMSGAVPGDFAWMIHMLQGDFAAAWQLADADAARRRTLGITGAGWPRHQRPVWDGAALAGRRVLVRCFHGLGDTIQFIRYVPLLAETAAAVRVEAQAELIPLLQTVRGIDRLVPLAETEAPDPAALDCDTEIDVTELPHAFHTTSDTIPARIPYLTPGPSRPPGLRQGGVAVVWAAGEWKPERSVPLELLSALATVPGIELVNLQRGPEYRRWRNDPAILPMEDRSSDEVAATAAAIADADLVLTVDTMVAHLAGALGAPVWLMLHFAADWRWMLGRSDSPWYPTMRLFRQPRPGDWASVVEAVAAALHHRAAARPHE